jgi:Zn finger protein HypA/HybF involved in hydrogenase expression
MAMYVNATSDSNPDCRCPHCNQGLEIEELEEPYNGGYENERCPKCHKDIRIRTSIVVTYTAEVV